ncbi:MAG: collagen-binding domain-containing protein [Pseudomonadota bacterium]
MPVRVLSFTAAAAFLLCGAAQATPLNTSQILTQFNTVVLGNATSSSHTDGRTYVGGTLSGGDYVQHPEQTAASNYAGLTVRGAASNVHVNGLGAVVGGKLSGSIVNSGSAVVKGGAQGDTFNGAAYVEGTASGNFNGGKASTLSTLMQTNLDAAGSTDFGTILNTLSDQLKMLTSTGSSVTFDGNRAIFNAVVNANGLAVFDLSAIDTVLFGKSEFQFNLNGARTVVLNTDIKNVSIGANFLGGAAQNYGKQLLWNFYDATDITLNSQWGGSLLATDAYLTNNQNIEGGVFVNSLRQQGEIHSQAFSGTLPSASSAVPEPGSTALVLAGLGLIGFMRRRRDSTG